MAHMIKQLLTRFDQHYQRLTGMPYPVCGKDAKLMSDLVSVYGEERLGQLIDHFFAMTDPFIAQAGWSVGVFRGCLPKVIASMQRVSTQPRVMSDGAQTVFQALLGEPESIQ